MRFVNAAGGASRTLASWSSTTTSDREQHQTSLGCALPYEITWEPWAVVVRFWGFVSPDEFLEGARRINADWRFDDLRFIVNDMLAVEGHAIDTPGVKEDLLAMSLGALTSNPRASVVVVSEDGRVHAFAHAIRQPGGAGPDPYLCPDMMHARQWMAQQMTRPHPWLGPG